MRLTKSQLRLAVRKLIKEDSMFKKEKLPRFDYFWYKKLDHAKNLQLIDASLKALIPENIPTTHASINTSIRALIGAGFINVAISYLEAKPPKKDGDIFWYALSRLSQAKEAYPEMAQDSVLQVLFESKYGLKKDKKECLTTLKTLFNEAPMVTYRDKLSPYLDKNPRKKKSRSA